MNTGTSSTDTEGRDIRWISAEIANVIPHPLQSVALINQTIIPKICCRRNTVLLFGGRIGQF